MKKMLLFTLSLLMTAQLLQGQALHPSAAFEISSTTQGFLPPRMTTAQRNAIQSPAEGLIVYNTSEESLEMHIGSDNWAQIVTNEKTEIVSNLPADPSDGDTYFNTTNNTLRIFREKVGWYSFKTSAADFIGEEIEHNNLTYKTTQSAGTGKIWLDRNIGATAEPTAVGSTGTQFGDFYTWDDARAANRCPPDFRLPTNAEWVDEELHFETPVQAFASLKLTLVGYRSGSGADPGWTGSAYYWSSNEKTGDPDDANTLILYDDRATVNSLGKGYGASVRCIMDY